MRRLIRHKATSGYLCEDGTWTQDASVAQHFDNIQSILSIHRQLALREVEIVLQIGSAPSREYDVVLPLQDPIV
jgi:hypothetical protein